mmetsp:Transcript_8117/g.20123  ORF Transcript_8117/g.20123 Transcript_8117/m.20123 type:complete len:263 (+) Transcript_8117:197-985(+)
MRFSSPLVFSLATAASASLRFSSLAAVAASTGSNSSRASAFISATGAIHNRIAENTPSPPSRLNSSSSGTERDSASGPMIDPEYPGTAVERMLAARTRVASLTQDDLNDSWDEVRRKILWAGGLKDLPTARPGQGYTGHSFNDYNHVDLTCMRDNVSNNENDGSVKMIAIGNQLGPGIRTASLPELGSGGSWSTCAIGCNQDPPQDVAHVQFRSRIGEFFRVYVCVYCSFCVRGGTMLLFAMFFVYIVPHHSRNDETMHATM